MSSRNTIPGSKRTCVATIVSETHWDRAWYLTFEEFRIRLVRLIDNLLRILTRDRSFKSFTLDGQTVVLEDYLEIRPERREELCRFIRQRRIMAGPWYVLPDMFLEGPEAMVRNLLLGTRISGDFGHTMQCAYVPDPFGHPAQLPQIVRGFGIDNIVFWRGIVPEALKLGTEFNWLSQDGKTSVLAIHQRDAYGNAVGLGLANPWPDLHPCRFSMEKAMEQIEKAVKQLIPAARTPNVLLNNGVDHTEAQPEIPRIVAAANRRLRTLRLNGGKTIAMRYVHGSFEDYVERVRNSRRKLGTYQGEMRAHEHPDLLTGTLSTRMPIKQANVKAQNLLVHLAETASAMCWYLTGTPVPQAEMSQAWRYVLRSHPHDDICGCSIDQVHRETIARLELARQIGEAVTSQSLEAIARRIDTTTMHEGRPVVVLNPLPWTREKVWTVTVDVPTVEPLIDITKPRANLKRMRSIVLKDNHGQAVPCQVVACKSINVINGIQMAPVDRFTLAVKSGLPACGYRTYVLSEKTGIQSRERGLQVSERWMENGLLRVTVQSNGTLTIRHLESGFEVKGVNLFEDTEDAGDEYNYSPAKKSLRLTTGSLRPSIRCIDTGPLLARFAVSFRWNLPAGLAPDHTRRSKKRVPVKICSIVTLTADAERVDIRTELENRASDHRLRALFPTPLRTRTSQAEGHFAVDHRPLPDRLPKGWPPEAEQTHPQQSFVSVTDGKRGVTLFNRGLPEYELLPGKQAAGRSTIALTLLRSVGWLSRGDLLTRPVGNAGPSLATPEAQCHGKHVFEYSIMLHRGDCVRAQAHRIGREFSVPLRAAVARRHKGILPEDFSLVELEPGQIAFTSLKKAEKGKGLVLRFYNPWERTITARVRFAASPRRVRWVNLAEQEERGGRLTVKGCEASLRAERNRIISLRFE